MHRLRILIGLFAIGVAAAIAPASAADSPVVTTSADGTQNFQQYINALGLKIFLSSEDARTYSSDLDGLVGNYFYVGDDGVIVLLGRPDNIPKATAIQLKDKIEYQAATDNGSSISATLPWLSFLFGNDVKTSILMQDIASVVGTSDPTVIHTYLPTGLAPAGKQIWFISGATVTLISATQYSDTSFDGSTVIQVGGKYLNTKNVLQNAWIISINRVPATAPVVAGGGGGGAAHAPMLALTHPVRDALSGHIVHVRRLPQAHH